MVFGSHLSEFGFVLMENGLFGFGENDNWQVGLDDGVCRNKLTLIPFFNSKNVKKIVCGWYHSIFLCAKNLFACGDNTYGQLNLGKKSILKSKVKVTQIQVIHEKKKQMIIIDIFVGGCHSFFLSSDLNLYGVGNNQDGQLGIGKASEGIRLEKVIIPEKILSSSCGSGHSVFLSINGNVYVSGCNGYGEICCKFSVNKVFLPKKLDFFEKTKTTIVQICTGRYHTLLLTSKNKVFASGFGGDGRLGLKQAPRLVNIPTCVSSLENEKIVSVKCGAYYSMFLSENKLWVCGDNAEGQLGIYCRNVNTPILFSIKGKEIIQSLLLTHQSVHFTKKNEIMFSSGYISQGDVGKSFWKNMTCSKNSKVKRYKKKQYKEDTKEMRNRIEYLMGENKSYEIIF